MKQGDLEEIKTESATILINRQPEMYVLVLLAVLKPTQILRSALNNFSREFCTQFADLFKESELVDEFQRADSLVEKFFPISQRLLYQLAPGLLDPFAGKNKIRIAQARFFTERP